MPTTKNVVTSAREFATLSPARDSAEMLPFGLGSLSSVLYVRLPIIVCALLFAILCAAPAHAQVQVVACDDAVMPANSPPFDCDGAGLRPIVPTGSCSGLGPDVGYLISELISEYAISVEEAWGRLDSTQRFTFGPPVPSDDIEYALRFEVTGMPPGQYAFHVDYSFTTIYTWSKGASCAVPTSGRAVNILTLTSTATRQFIDPVPNLMSGN